MSAGSLFARYAYPPNALGYCGPPDLGALLAVSSPSAGAGDLASVAQSFSGAWPYLELIAAANGIADPLDVRVVAAYWVGSELLEGIPAAALLDAVGKLPDSGLGGGGTLLRHAVMSGGVAHHSFHVFAVYPWLTLLRSGREEPALTVLERCRIRWGVVETFDGAEVVVRSRPVGLEGRDLVLLGERSERVRCIAEGAGFVADLAAGDLVSLHWDWVCDRISPDELTLLEYFTERSLHAVNTIASANSD